MTPLQSRLALARPVRADIPGTGVPYACGIISCSLIQRAANSYRDVCDDPAVIIELSFRCFISSAVDPALVGVHSDATGASKHPWCSSTVYFLAHSHGPPSDLDGTGNDIVDSYASQLLFSNHATHSQSPHVLHVLTASTGFSTLTADGVIFIYSGSGSSVMRWSCRQNCGDTTTICVMTVVTVMNTYCRHCIVAGIVLCAPDAPDSMESWFMAVLHLKLARGSDGSASGSTRTATNVGGSNLTVITVDDARTIGVAHETHSITCSQLGS